MNCLLYGFSWDYRHAPAHPAMFVVLKAAYETWDGEFEGGADGSQSNGGHTVLCLW
jgi:hypothetical protein